MQTGGGINNINKVRECTCKCIVETDIDNNHFYKNREYQVDVYPLYYQIYRNGGWNDYIFINEEEFNKYFKLII